MRPWFEHLFGRLSDGVWWWCHHLFRKSGHFLGYGLVGVTFFRAWRMMQRTWRRSYLLGVGCTFLVACADEWHQTFIPSRTGTFTDVLLDTVGAGVVCGIVWIVWERWEGNEGHPPPPVFEAKSSFD